MNHNLYSKYSKTILMLMASATISGCASFSAQVERHTLAYNYTQEEIANQMILVNAIRAKNRRPMHFTTLSKVTGNLTLSGGGTLAIPFGKNFSEAMSVNTLTPTTTISSSPNFDVIPENKSEFIKGITTPISLQTFTHFWQQGWPKDLLILLFVQKVEIIPKNNSKITQVFINTPDPAEAPCVFSNFRNHYPNNIDTDWCRYVAFRDLIDTYLPSLRIVQKHEILELGAFETPDTLEDLKRMTEILEKENIGHKKNINGNIGILKTSTSINACITDEHKFIKPIDVFSDSKACGVDTADSQAFKSNFIRFNSIDENADNSIDIIAHFRSPQSAIYYLGEVLRAQENDNKITVCRKYRSDCASEQVPLFIVEENYTGESAVSVQYTDNRTYSIPSDPEIGGRSMTVLSLLSQVFAMNREASELPSTTTVNVLD